MEYKVRNTLVSNPVFWAVPLILILLSWIIRDPYRVSADCSFFLYAGTLLLNGGKLYLDWFDINPPLIFYFNTIPGAIANFFSLHTIPVFLFSVFILIVWSTFSINKSLSKSGMSIPVIDRALMACCWVMFNLFVLHQNDFGQRDHLLILLFGPYFIVRWLRWSCCEIGNPRAAMIGITAALGVLLKPAFMVIPIIMEVYWLIRSHFQTKPLLHSESIAFIVTGLIYALHFLILPQDVLNYLFRFVLPLTTAVYPKHAAISTLEVLNHKLLFAILLLVLWAYLFFFKDKSHTGSLAKSSVVLVCATFIVYVIQHKGFSYHFIPMLGAGSLVGGLLMGALIRSSFGHLGVAGKYASVLVGVLGQLNYVIILILSVIALTQVFHTNRSLYKENKICKAIARYSSPDEYILFLSPEVLAGWPCILQMKRLQATRFSGALFTLPVLEKMNADQHDTQTRPQDFEKTILQGLLQDIESFKPKAIFIDDYQWQPSDTGFRISEYLAKNNFIEEIKKNYKLVENDGRLAVYVEK